MERIYFNFGHAYCNYKIQLLQTGFIWLNIHKIQLIHFFKLYLMKCRIICQVGILLTEYIIPVMYVKLCYKPIKFNILSEIILHNGSFHYKTSLNAFKIIQFQQNFWSATLKKIGFII